jgi:hypothetical protein
MKTLLQLIEQTLLEERDLSEDASILAKRVERIIKDASKALFFKGKVSSLIAYLCTEERSPNEEIGLFFQSKLNEKENLSPDFVSRMQKLIANEMRAQNLDPNLDGLLVLLQLQHLSPMLSMFKL